MSTEEIINLFSAASAVTIAEIATLPICTTKTNHINTKSTSIVNTVKNVYASGGIRAFYRASIPATITQIFSSTSKFVLYKYFNTKSQYTVLNSVAAGVITSMVTHPLDGLKIYMQMNNSFLNDLRDIGPKLLYRGYSKSFSKTVIGSALFFPLNDYLKVKTKSPFYGSMISAVVSTLVMHPLDYLKTRHIAGLSLYEGFNPLIYYKGLSLNLARIVPHFVIMMTLIDKFSTIAKKKHNIR